MIWIAGLSFVAALVAGYAGLWAWFWTLLVVAAVSGATAFLLRGLDNVTLIEGRLAPALWEATKIGARETLSLTPIRRAGGAMRRFALPTQKERLAADIYKRKLAEGSPVLAQKAASTAHELEPLAARFEELSATPNAQMSVDEKLQWAQIMRHLEEAGADTDAMMARHRPAVGLGAKLWRRGIGVLGVTPYGRAAIIVKWALIIAPWFGMFGTWGLWQGERADNARLKANNRQLASNFRELAEANDVLKDRALMAEAVAEERAAALQNAQDRQAELMREAAARQVRARKREVVAKQLGGQIDAEAERDPAGVEWNGADWVRERADRAGRIRDLGLSGVPLADPGATGPGVLPEGPGADIPLFGTTPDDTD